MKAPQIPSFLTSAPFLTAIRVLVGGLFVYAGLAKLMDPHAFLKAIDSFRILPTALISPLAIMLPPLEVVAGIAWIMNRCSKAAATIILGLCVVFLGALGLALLRGVSADCGCFVGLGAGSSSLGMASVRDVVLVAAAGWWLIAERRKQPAGSDGWPGSRA